MGKHRFVLVGHGKIAGTYLKTISSLPDAEVAGVVGRNSERVQAYAREKGIPAFGTDLKEVAHRSQATAAVICTPNAAHEEGVLQASRLGLHCLCEKPLHIHPETQERMIENCRNHGVVLAVSYMRRFHSHLQWIKKLIDEGRLGRITVVDVMIKHFRPASYYEGSWHGTEEWDGGGPFIQQGSHILDLALWMCGGYREVLEAKRFQAYHDIETEDHGYALVRYGNGAVGMIEASTASIGFEKEYIEISGTRGSLAANYDRITDFDVPGIELPEFDRNEPIFEKLVSDFMEAVEEGRAPYVDGESAKKATELVRDIYAKSGKPIKITDW